jgi:hypothetical protein
LSVSVTVRRTTLEALTDGEFLEIQSRHGVHPSKTST